MLRVERVMTSPLLDSVCRTRRDATSGTRGDVTVVCFSLSDETRRYVWDKRHYLLRQRRALPWLLQAATAWSARALTDIYGLVQSCEVPEPTDALELLLPW